MAGSYNSGVLSSAPPVPPPPPASLLGPRKKSFARNGEAAGGRRDTNPLMLLLRELRAFCSPHCLRPPQMQGQPPPSTPT